MWKAGNAEKCNTAGFHLGMECTTADSEAKCLGTGGETAPNSECAWVVAGVSSGPPITTNYMCAHNSFYSSYGDGTWEYWTKCGAYHNQEEACKAYDPAPAAAGYVMTDSNIRTAVDAWFSDATAAEATYGHISTWETSGVTDMFALFRNKGSFNEDISAWKTSGVTDMSELFSGSSFNEDIGAWDTSGVETMRYMFYGASAFNQDIGNWAVHSVKNLFGMFLGASAFDQDLSGWAVQSVTSMEHVQESLGLRPGPRLVRGRRRDPRLRVPRHPVRVDVLRRHKICGPKRLQRSAHGQRHGRLETKVRSRRGSRTRRPPRRRTGTFRRGRLAG